MKQAVRYQLAGSMELFEGGFSKQTFPWHYHDAYTVVLVETGAVEYLFRDGRVLVQKEELFIVNPYEAHFNRDAAAGGWTYRVFFLPEQWLQTGNGKSRWHFTRQAIPNAVLYAEAVNLFRLLQSATTQQLYNAGVQQLLSLLLAQVPATVFTPAVDERVLPAMQYIAAHLGEKLSISRLAHLCCMSHFHFQRVFKESTGLTVHHYIQQQRMEQGKACLRSNSNIAAVAMETGYFDQSHFHRQFRKMYGLTPGRFGR